MSREPVSASARIRALARKARWLRRTVLDMTLRAGAGHIAPSFSCAEILVSLYYELLRVNPEKPRWDGRDRFILSKGQAAVALYAVLADLGFFPVSELKTFTQAGSRLGGHTEDTIPGVEAFTGSLGMGLSIACGMALAAKIDRKHHLCVGLLGDGECHEGSVWEAAMFGAHHRLDNLLVIVDHNGLSATDFLRRSVNVEPMREKWEAFGWDTAMVDGHDFGSLLAALDGVRDRKSGKPLALIALTTKGRGVSFMENRPIWHYRIPVGREAALARAQLASDQGGGTR